MHFVKPRVGSWKESVVGGGIVVSVRHRLRVGVGVRISVMVGRVRVSVRASADVSRMRYGCPGVLKAVCVGVVYRLDRLSHVLPARRRSCTVSTTAGRRAPSRPWQTPPAAEVHPGRLGACASRRCLAFGSASPSDCLLRSLQLAVCRCRRTRGIIGCPFARGVGQQGQAVAGKLEGGGLVRWVAVTRSFSVRIAAERFRRGTFRGPILLGTTKNTRVGLFNRDSSSSIKP